VIDLTKEKQESIMVNERERKLIELLRDTEYGQVAIYLEAGQPVRIERIKESIKL